MNPAEMYPDNPQAQALVKAAIKGNAKEIDRLIDAGADPNAVGTQGITVPGWVLYHPDRDGFRRLLERGADPNKIWDDGVYYQRSLMHLAAGRSDRIGVEYLKMCLEIGKGDPNLVTPDKIASVISQAVDQGKEEAFAMLYKAGAKLIPEDVIRGAASSSNYKLVLYLLENNMYKMGTHEGADRIIKNGINLDLYSGTLARDPSVAPQYMWFWRCVSWLEKHGLVFDYTPAEWQPRAVRPAVLDTTPPDVLNVPAAKAVEPPKNINMFMHQVNLTFPLPFWADTPETSENVKARQTQKPGIITLDYLPKDQTENDWKTLYTASTTYTPGTTLDETLRLVQKTLRAGSGSDATITSEESTTDHHILRFALQDASHTEGVLYIGRFLDTIVTVRAMWRSVDAATASAYHAKALAGMRQIVMKKGLTVLPMN